MSLIKARVGRHANTGNHCQNYVEDQRVVITYLAEIPVSEGGAVGSGLSINGLKGGIAKDDLYQAILRFQKKQFPSNQSGFIEPVGPQIAKMAELADRAANAAPPKAPREANQWDGIKTKSVDKALRKALADLTITHEEVVDIIYATLSDGYVSPAELADLSTIAAVSKSLAPASKTLLQYFAPEMKSTPGGAGPYRFPLEKHRMAAQLVCDFLKRGGRTAFPKLSRELVGMGLLMRIANPGLVSQGEASLCGPAVLIFNILTANPVQYARYAIDLFEKGKGKIGRLQVEPGKDVRNRQPDPSEIAQADWLTMASLRDSENWFLDYDLSKDRIDMRISGVTLPGELAHWFRLAGFSDIREETNLSTFHKGAGTVDDANKLFDKGYRVCLMISANMMSYDDQSSRGSVLTRHWIVQQSRIDLSGGKAKLEAFSWGEGKYTIPHPNKDGQTKDMSADEFLGNFYGYVAAQP